MPGSWNHQSIMSPLHTAPEGLAASAVYYANLAAAELKIDGHMSEAVMACRCVSVRTKSPLTRSKTDASVVHSSDTILQLNRAKPPPMCESPHHHCSDAIDLDPSYSKAYMRRSTAYESLDDLDNALADARKVGR